MNNKSPDLRGFCPITIGDTFISMKYVSKNEGDTKKIANEFVENLFKTRAKAVKKATIVALHGDLGSGKTTFTKAVACVFGVRNTITSPTFVIEKTYKIQGKPSKVSGFSQLIHIDAYRLEKSSDLDVLGWEEMTAVSENLIFIEWPEKVKGAIPRDAQKIRFKFINETTREIHFS